MVCKARQSYSLGSQARSPSPPPALGRYPHPAALDDLADHRARGSVLLEGVDEGRRSILRHRGEQSAARLRVVERQEVVRADPVGDHAPLQILPVALEPAGVASRRGQGYRSFPDWYFIAAHDGADAAC